MGPNSVVERMKAGLFRLNAAHFLPRAAGLEPVFGQGRVAVLRRKLLGAGLDPLALGLPAVQVDQLPLVLATKRLGQLGPSKQLKYQF